MFHRLWTLIRKELQSLLREPQTRAILVLPVLIRCFCSLCRHA